VPILSDDELTTLLQVCAGRDVAALRDAAMVRVLLDAGVRVSELCGLTVEGVGLDLEMHWSPGRAPRSGPPTSRHAPCAPWTSTLRERRRHRWAHLEALLLTSGARCPRTAPVSGSRSGVPRRDKRSSPAPFPALIHARLPDGRRAGAGPQAARRLVVGRDARTLWRERCGRPCCCGRTEARPDDGPC